MTGEGVAGALPLRSMASPGPSSEDRVAGIGVAQVSFTASMSEKLRDDAEVEKQRQKAAEAKKPGGSK